MKIDYTIPVIEDLPALEYIGIRCVVPIGSLDSVIGKFLDEGTEWLNSQKITPNGPPIIRYYSCPTLPNADALLDICIGWPLSFAVNLDSRFIFDTLPAGKYASLVYVGIENGIAGNEALLQWGKTNGIVWDSWPIDGGDGFSGRMEHLLDGPEDDENPSHWRTKVAIKIKEQ